LCDICIDDLTRSCKPLVSAFYMCSFVLVNKHNLSFTFDVTSAGREAIRPLSAEFGQVT